MRAIHSLCTVLIFHELLKSPHILFIESQERNKDWDTYELVARSLTYPCRENGEKNPKRVGTRRGTQIRSDHPKPISSPQALHFQAFSYFLQLHLALTIFQFDIHLCQGNNTIQKKHSRADIYWALDYFSNTVLVFFFYTMCFSK